MNRLFLLNDVWSLPPLHNLRLGWAITDKKRVVQLLRKESHEDVNILLSLYFVA